MIPRGLIARTNSTPTVLFKSDAPRKEGEMRRDGQKIGFVRNVNYDNSRAVRKWTPAGPDAGGTWAWPILRMDIRDFMREYHDINFAFVDTNRYGAPVAVSWPELDAFVCGRSDVEPAREPFDIRKHTVQKELTRSWLDESVVYPYFRTPYAVWFPIRVASGAG